MPISPNPDHNATDDEMMEIVRSIIGELNSQSAEIQGGLNPLDIRHILISTTVTVMSHIYCDEHVSEMLNEQSLETWMVAEKAEGTDVTKLHPANRIGRFCTDMFMTAARYEGIDYSMGMHAATRLFTSLLMELTPLGQRAGAADMMLKQIKEMVAMAETQEKAMSASMPEGAVN